MHSDDVLQKAEAARKALGELSAARKKEQTDARKRIEGLEREENNVLHGTKVALNAISKDRQEALDCLGDDDDDSELEEPAAPAEDPQPEPASENDDEPNGSNSVFDQGDVNTDDFVNGLYTRSDLEGMTNERLLLLANAYGMDMRIGNFNRDEAIDRILRAQHRWCLENDVEDPNGYEPTRINRATSVRDWSGVQWLLAGIGAFIALLIALATRDIFDDIEGFGRGAVVFFWTVFVTMTGFFGGGLIGSFIDLDDNND